MVFNFYPAAKNLQSFIKGYLEADSSTSKVKAIHKLFPNGYSGIFFNFGNLGKISVKEEYDTPRVSIFGQIDQSFEAIHWPGSYSLGVILEPTALSKFLQADMAEFTNRTFDGQLLRSDLQLLHGQFEEFDIKRKIELLDHYFIKAFSQLPQRTTPTDAALQLIHVNANLPVHKIAKELKMSERYLESQFKKTIGLSPKTYSLIIRFKRIERQLMTNPTTRWSKMDFTLEYYDQNHFIKDFKRFTGHTPSAYLLNNLEMGRSYLVG